MLACVWRSSRGTGGRTTGSKGLETCCTTGHCTKLVPLGYWLNPLDRQSDQWNDFLLIFIIIIIRYNRRRLDREQTRSIATPRCYTHIAIAAAAPSRSGHQDTLCCGPPQLQGRSSTLGLAAQLPEQEWPPAGRAKQRGMETQQQMLRCCHVALVSERH
ncbi:unnamed protein product [Lota lota]